ncbi:hypothetical protein AB0M87_04665 [Streptomyces sp. NPDC051320]|uniref:hypothetical protein n=1 Tax=Streptomyces sp. NPDC051320 TaxID=3154644 RepID=UPI003420868A
MRQLSALLAVGLCFACTAFGITPITESAAVPGRTEGDTKAPPFDQRANTELVIDLTWTGANEAHRVGLCAGRYAHDSPAIDWPYAARLIREKCHAR